MGKYIFFIGGSGARAYKAFLHCCAAGVIRQESVDVLLLDADQKNKANLDCNELYKIYDHQRNILSNQNVNEFKCKINMNTEGAVSPVNHDISYLTQVTGQDSTELRVMSWLYTEKERTQKLEKGFYAHPNIGCVFFQDIQNKSFLNCLRKLKSELNSDSTEAVDVALVGSVFGGTGASGIPCILKSIYDYLRKEVSEKKFGKMHLGGVLITPYFKIPDKIDNDDDILINDQDFYFNTVDSLKYYRFFIQEGMDKTQEHFNSIYVVGQNELDVVNSTYVDGGENQENKPHIVELYAALALKQFFENPKKEGIWGCINTDDFKWDTFVKELYSLAGMIRAQVVFANAIYPYVIQKKISEKNRNIMVPQWYKIYQLKKSENQEIIEGINNYSTLLLSWAYGIQSVIEADGTFGHSNKIHLCGDVIQDIGKQVAIEKDNEKNNKEKDYKKILMQFNHVIDTTSNIEYAFEKVILILSLLGVVPKSVAAGGCAALLVRLFDLVKKQK